MPGSGGYSNVVSDIGQSGNCNRARIIAIDFRNNVELEDVNSGCSNLHVIDERDHSVVKSGKLTPSTERTTQLYFVPLELYWSQSLELHQTKEDRVRTVDL